MADYFPLLSRALDALPDRSPEMRRTVYDRARGALVQQLRSLEPPLTDEDIAKEQSSLDEAIGRLEAKFEPEDVAPDEMPEEALLPAGPRLPPATRPPLLPEPDPPSPELRVLPPRREPIRAAVRDAAEDVAPESVSGGVTPDETGPQRPRIAFAARPRDRAAIMRKTAGVVALAVVVALIAVAAWLLRDKPSDLPVVGADGGVPRAAEDGDTKFAERVGGDRQPTAAAGSTSQGSGQQGGAPAAPGAGQAPAAAAPARSQGDVAIAQRAILYEEDPANPQSPRATAGRALWRLDAVNTGQGQPLETVVRGTVDVPEAGMSLAFTMRRNLDATLPASHTIELAFTTQAARTIRDAGVPQLKAEESARGAPLAGLPVPVRDNLFLIGLGNAPSDVERNLDLLRTRNWFDVPVRYASGGRAVLSFEKGSPGEKAFADAFALWR